MSYAGNPVTSGIDPAVKRPIVRYFGGKFLMAPKIVQHFPDHHSYIEPFGGGGSVLLRKRRSHAEIYNDLDRRMINLFEVLRDDAKAEQLERRLQLF